MRSEWLKELRINELPAPYQDIARSFGVEIAVGIAEEFGGMTWYFPKLDRSLRKLRDVKMREAFTGANHRELARKYNLTERQIRTIVEVKESRQAGLGI